MVVKRMLHNIHWPSHPQSANSLLQNASFGQRLNTRQLSWRPLLCPLELQRFQLLFANVARLCKALDRENERWTNYLSWTVVCTSGLRPFIQRLVHVLACFASSKPFYCFTCICFAFFSGSSSSWTALESSILSRRCCYWGVNFVLSIGAPLQERIRCKQCVFLLLRFFID